MGRKLTVTLDLEVWEDATDEDVNAMLVKVAKNLGEQEIFENYEVRAPGIRGWDSSLPAERSIE